MKTTNINTFILSAAIKVGFITYPQLKDFLMAAETHKHPLLTTDYLCGQHAYYFSTSTNSINKRTMQSELKLLKTIGVNFDEEIALKYALNFAKMLNNPTAKLIWL